MSLLWKPTLAATLPVDADLSSLPYPLWASPKYDGRRALVQGGNLVSRNGIVVPNRSACEPIEALDLEGYDGELVVGPATAPNVRNRTMSYLATQGHVETGEVVRREPLTYYVFDWFDESHEQPFEERQVGVRPSGVPVVNVIDKWTKVVIVKQKLIKTPREIAQYEAEKVSDGHEGVMLRSANSGKPYMQKRSTLREFELVKWKRWETGEAVILAAHPLEHNLNISKTAAGRKSSKKVGMVKDAMRFGSATMRDVKTKAEFSVQIPGEKLQRWNGWRMYAADYLQMKFVYKYQPGAKGVPIHPTCAFAELGVE